MIVWRAGCSGMGTSGSEGGQQKPTSRKADRALLSDPYSYVWTLAGFVYVALVVDVFSRRILGVAGHHHQTHRHGHRRPPASVAGPPPRRARLGGRRFDPSLGCGQSGWIQLVVATPR